MIELKKRIDWIDTTRGIAIILVVLGHCIGYVDSTVNKVILAFHMPLFFFLSGCCAKKNDEHLYYFMRKKFKQLFPAQLILSVICIVYDYIVKHSFNVTDNLFIWFLPVLFYTEVIFKATIGLFDSKILFIISICCALLISKCPVHTMIKIEIVPVAFVFYLCGHLFMNICGGGKDRRQLKRISLLCIVTIIISRKNKAILMYENVYGSFFLFILGAMSGIISAYAIGRLNENSSVLKWFGKNSLKVYVLHFKMTNILHFLFFKIFSINQDLYLFPWYLLIFGIEMALLFVIIECVNKIENIIKHKLM